MKIPHRNSMMNEAADSLREAIRSGEVTHHLPSVRKLSRDLHVSIPTVLGAVHILKSEGIVRSEPGRRTRILTGRKNAGKTREAARQVIFLSFGSNWVSGSDYYQSVLTELWELGIKVRLLECPYIQGTLAQKEIEELTSTEKPDCWILLGPPANVQTYFSKKELPCLIDGVTIPGLPFPDFDVNFDALYRHAVNHLQRNGHQRICLLTTEHSAKINPDSMEAFRSSVMERLVPGISWEPVRTYNGSTEQFINLLQSLFSDRNPKPTALVITLVKRVATAMTWLMNQNLRIPGDVSIISRDHADTLECLYPVPAHYLQPPSASKRFVRAILAVLDNKHIRSHNRIMTEFVPGNTIGQLKK